MIRRAHQAAIVLPHLIAVTLAAITVAVVVTYRDVEIIVSASRWIRHTDEVLISLERVAVVLNEAESGQRGYIITADPKYLGRYESSRQGLPRMLDRMVELVKDNPPQQGRIRSLRDATLTKFTEMDSIIATHRSKGFEAARDEVLSDRGFVLMAQCHEVTEIIQREEDILLKQRRKWLNDTFNRMVITVVILKALFIVFLYFLWRKKVLELQAMSQHPVPS